MRGASEAALTAVTEQLESLVAQAGSEAILLGDQLLAVASVIRPSGVLLRALTDPSRDGDSKQAVVAELFGGKIDQRVVALVSSLVSQRWSRNADLLEALELLGFDAIMAGAQAAGTLEQVEEELFDVDRMLVGQRELRQTLWNVDIPYDQRLALMRRVFSGKINDVTLDLLEHTLDSDRHRSLTSSILELEEIAAKRRHLSVGFVVSAVPLSQAQYARIKEMLTRLYGNGIQLNASVDPEIVGGLRIQVGDEVVDATMVSRLEDARKQMVG